MKKILPGIIFISLFILGWYLFVKQYDYQFNITAYNSPGAIYSEIIDWKNFSASPPAGDIAVTHKTPFEIIKQRATVDSLNYIEMLWEIQPANDTVTNLTVSIRSTKNSFRNRLGIINPFQNSIYLDTLKERLISFQQQLRNQQKFYNVVIDDEIANFPATACVCTTSVNIDISKKAAAMVNTIDHLENFVVDRKLKLNGYPFLKVTKWDRNNDLIDFDFCFPVTSITGLEETGRIQLKHHSSQQAVKAIFNGNYRLSHIAWHDLLYYSHHNGITTTGLPFEIFHNNPRTEENPISWTAEIYLPVL